MRDGRAGGPSAVLVRRDWLDTVGLFDESLRWIEDWDFCLRLAANGCRFAWLPELVCRRRLYGSNMVRNVKRMREGNLAALDKLYACLDLPQDVRAVRDQAYAAAHIRAAVRAYGARTVSEAEQDVLRVIELDPSLLHGNPCRLVKMLVGWAGDVTVGHAGEYLSTLVRYLPSHLPSVRRQVRKAMSDWYMAQMFTAHGLGGWETVRACLVRGPRLDPIWLQNRGVLTIPARTFLPILRQYKITEADYHVAR